MFRAQPVALHTVPEMAEMVVGGMRPAELVEMVVCLLLHLPAVVLVANFAAPVEMVAIQLMALAEMLEAPVVILTRQQMAVAEP